MSTKFESVGICIGASTISAVRTKKRKQKIEIDNLITKEHGGDPKTVLKEVMDELKVSYSDNICVTGRKLSKKLNLSSISEPNAVELAYETIKDEYGECSAIVSAGGETFMAYALDSKGKISRIVTGNKCASGTGEFFFQQLRRMDVSIEEAADFAETAKPYQVSGRCSVFCKSDCTHATNKGVPKQEVTAGLCRMMSEKILGLLKKVDLKNIMLTGGTSKNKTMIRFLKEKINNLIVPFNAACFEAFGASVYALENDIKTYEGIDNLFLELDEKKDFLPPIKNFSDKVTFKTIVKDKVKKGDRCIFGLDVGSTTTKAVLLRKDDSALLSSVYLRTNGDPVGASVKCYKSILEDVKKETNPSDITIEALGVTGSGRKIAGLHAGTEGVINEIIAHAKAALYFDSGVDTIFEIGGQDAKYTHITAGVPSDYAMNEACSAGTGSFLEESAFETLGIKMEEIGDIAFKGEFPPNFNDQCAAFISSDIKNAIHEGVKKEDIVAGLVYSICMNYSNRVKGNRPVGEKIFMQGGVCYNKAVPTAMTFLTGKPVVVPPEPGLMGAFGVALEVSERMDEGEIKKSSFNLDELSSKELKFGTPFTCQGGKDKCDRKCEISIILSGDEKLPFGGACNRYENLRKKEEVDMVEMDLVRYRQDLIFNKFAAGKPENLKGTIGFNKSFLINTYFPLYSTFFAELGYEAILPELPSQSGMDERNSAFCYPAELAHGFIYSLINQSRKPDYVFLPHLKAVPSLNNTQNSQVCPFVQGESFFLKSVFRKDIERKGIKILSPMLDMTEGEDKVKSAFIKTAVSMGEKKKDASKAFDKALKMQKECISEMKRKGKEVLDHINRVSHKKTIILFGRPYNAFQKEAHMGIPGKIASRNVQVIPFDFIPFESEDCPDTMYWGVGQQIMKAAEFTSKNPNLFGIFITNFSCGPDSFLVHYFRNIMDKKPSLTLELDSHTADAGIETRIEAFFDITEGYKRTRKKDYREKQFKQAGIHFEEEMIFVETSSGLKLPLKDKRVKLLFPSMGFGTDLLTSVFRANGYNAVSCNNYNEEILKTGRANTSCKECLPLILTTGNLLNYVEKEKKDDEVLVYFMPSTNGPCRFGQYSVFIKNLIDKKEIENTAVLSLNSDNTYDGFGKSFEKHIWSAILISDAMEDIKSMLLANASDKDSAIKIFNEEWEKLVNKTENSTLKMMIKDLKRAASALRKIELKKPSHEVPTISLVGEIFVRRDSLSRRNITEILAEKGFATSCAPVSEWIFYTDYLTENQLSKSGLNAKERIKLVMKRGFMEKYEKKVKKILKKTGLYQNRPLSIKKIVKKASPYISPTLTGEAILTIGGAIHEIADHSCGVISIGPFGCMPGRIAESVLTDIMKSKNKLESTNGNKKHYKKLEGILEDVEDLPFLAIESDGSDFTQLIDAKIDAFLLAAERLHRKMI